MARGHLLGWEGQLQSHSGQGEVGGPALRGKNRITPESALVSVAGT